MCGVQDHGTDVTLDCYGVKMAVCAATVGLALPALTVERCCEQIYLEPTTADTGALRLVPGSHFEPLHTELREMGVGSQTEDLLPSYVCDSTPGDVVM